jgi:hypothetical protein
LTRSPCLNSYVFVLRKTVHCVTSAFRQVAWSALSFCRVAPTCRRFFRMGLTVRHPVDPVRQLSGPHQLFPLANLRLLGVVGLAAKEDKCTRGFIWRQGSAVDMWRQAMPSSDTSKNLRRPRHSEPILSICLSRHARDFARRGIW